MPKVSVVMPALNVVKYIEQCMESVIHQTLYDLEILVIDAGSTDGTLEILQKYEAQDNRVRLINSDRKSYGYQLNLGISMAQGDYIGVVETDDMAMPHMFEVLVQVADLLQVDYAKGYPRIFIDGIDGSRLELDRKLVDAKEQVNHVICPADMPGLLLRDIYLWQGIYKKEFLADIRLNETSGAAFQDQGFLLKTISSAKRAVYLDKPVYLYRRNNADSSIYNPKGLQYIAEEYSLNRPFLSGKSNQWHEVFFTRMLQQIIMRFKNMAYSGRFWSEAVESIRILQSMLTESIDSGYLKHERLSEQEATALELFLDRPESLFHHFQKEYRSKIMERDSLMQLAANNQIVIFGCGKQSSFVHTLLEHGGAKHIKAYCDNNQKLWGTNIRGLSVISPQQAIKDYPGASFIITSKFHSGSIKEQLLNMGVSVDTIYTYSSGVDLLLLK